MAIGRKKKVTPPVDEDSLKERNDLRKKILALEAHVASINERAANSPQSMSTTVVRSNRA